LTITTATTVYEIVHVNVHELPQALTLVGDVIGLFIWLRSGRSLFLLENTAGRIHNGATGDFSRSNAQHFIEEEIEMRGKTSFNLATGHLFSCFALLIALLPGNAQGDTAYQKPPKAVLDILDAPAPPDLSVSPANDLILLTERVKYPSISDLAQPMVRLAGLRINPKTNGPHRSQQITGMTLLKILDGTTRRIILPPGSIVGSPSWSADGKYIAFTNTTGNGVELWVAETASATARKIPGVALNAAYGDPLQWMPDQRTLLIQTLPAARGKPPAASPAPKGPTIQENYAKKAPVWTFQDLLKNAHDEDLFDYYAMSQLGTVEASTGRWTQLGKPGIFQSVDPSTDGKLILVARVHRPYSYLVTHSNFPKEVEVWNRSGAVAHTVASLPLQEQVPADGVPVGPRDYLWSPTEPATLVWVEALDEGNPRNKAPHRDRIMSHRAPFLGNPVETLKTELRCTDIRRGDSGDIALATEFDRPTRRTRTWLVNSNNPAEGARKIWDRNSQDRYNDPGMPHTRVLPNGKRAILQQGSSIFLTGLGASPEGDRPFLDQFDLRSLQSKRLFRCGERSFETVISVLSADRSEILTRYESLTEPPNIVLRMAGSDREKRRLTSFTDPTPALRKIEKQLVTYKRPDGVQLSFTLYLPPDYKPGERLPTVIWAYPLEYTDPQTASQVTGSPYRFTAMEGPSHLFFLTQGYAVLDGASMPVVGDAETVNNTYLDQIVASAKAAIEKAAEMGVTDPHRVGVGGHSYGAFMTANLLSHSDLFRAGIARSGAYNRTLTPFGFQSERRTLWEAPELYFKVSPFLFAHKINTPILLIHGEADNNSGTFPVQSERYYHALKGNGKAVRYVTLPLEAHGYAARESIEHTLYEQITWFEKWVKNAPPQRKTSTSSENRQ